MAGESQQTPQSEPDPSVLTTDAITRAIRAERDYTDAQFEVLRTRLDGMDQATKVLSDTVTRTPTDIQQEVGHLKELTYQHFDSIQTQFRERDSRFDLRARDNELAVSAALAAQKEAAGRQDEANAKAIDKSERATAETIKTNAELATSKTEGLAKSIDELKLQVASILATKIGATENRTGLYAAIGIVGTILSIVIVISNLLTKAGP